jgi:hypothetical protein
MYVDLIVARPEEAGAVADDPSLSRFESLELPRDLFDVAWLVGAIEGVREPSHPGAYKTAPEVVLPVVVARDRGEVTVQRFPDALVDRIASVRDERIEALGATWAQLQLQRVECTTDDERDYVSLLGKLVRMARNAKRDGAGLLLRVAL